MITKIAEGNLQTKFGEYHEILFYDGQKESIALIMGNVYGEEEVLCRIHSSCIAAHYFNSTECDCREQLEIAQRLIQQKGKGIIIWLDQEGKGNGHFALLKSKPHKDQGLTQSASYETIGFKRDARGFACAAEILQEVGIKSVCLITNNSDKAETLNQFGVKVAGLKETSLTQWRRANAGN